MGKPTLVYQNVNSLRSNYKYLAAEENELQADVLVLAETRVSQADAQHFSLGNYHCVDFPADTAE